MNPNKTNRQLLDELEAGVEKLRGYVERDQDPVSARSALRAVETAKDKTIRRIAGMVDDKGVTDWPRFREAVRNADDYTRAAEQLRVAVRSEPRTYGPAHPENSFFVDLARSVAAGPHREPALERLRRNADEVRVDEPDRYRSIQRDLERNDSGVRPETRAASSSTMAGFTTPSYHIEQFAKFQSPYRTIANACTSVPLPDYGLAVHVPSFTSDTAVAIQSAENATVTNSAASGADLTANLDTIAGGVQVSQQLYDRGGMPGLSFDQILLEQVRGDLDAQVDSVVITAALANAGTGVTDTKTTSASTAVVVDIVSDLARAASQVTGSGVNTPADHVFMPNVWVDFFTSLTDGQSRPIFAPDAAALVAAAGDPQFLGWSGFHIGRLGVYADDNIPASSSNAQLIVARPSDWLLFESETPLSFAYPETDAADLSVYVGFRVYATAIIRHTSTVQPISGARYPSTPTFPAEV